MLLHAKINYDDNSADKINDYDNKNNNNNNNSNDYKNNRSSCLLIEFVMIIFYQTDVSS